MSFLPTKDGNIFICDKAIMDGIPARNYNGEPLDVTAGFCLFYLNPDNKLMPIAIQVQYSLETSCILYKFNHTAILHFIVYQYVFLKSCTILKYNNLIFFNHIPAASGTF